MAINSSDKIKLFRPVPGDTLGIVAPSSPFDKHKFRKGVSAVEAMGFNVFFQENIFARNGYLAGSDAHRTDILHSMFVDPNIKGIICARGGYGALRMLSLIDFDIIAANPKIFIGCSDVTVLLNVFYSRCGLFSFHGPMIESLAGAANRTNQSLRDSLLADQDLILTADNPAVIRPGKAAGVMAGGNLTTLCHMVGTRFAPDFSGQILLLEDIGESPYRIDRMLVQMKLAGCFKNIRGIALGSFKDCGEPEAVYRIFDDIFSDDSFPIIAGFSVGHDEPNLTVPFGVKVSLDTVSKTLSFGKLPFEK